MFDTYGENPLAVRGFIEGGWKTMQNADGELSHEGQLFRVDFQDFENDILPTLDKVYMIQICCCFILLLSVVVLCY